MMKPASSMDDGKCLMWVKRKHVVGPCFPPRLEEQVFSGGGLVHEAEGWMSWPPRSYSCSFCKREFKSAQALGGHMNVHRRDRAMLKQIPTTEATSHHHDQDQDDHHQDLLIKSLASSQGKFPSPAILLAVRSPPRVPNHDDDDHVQAKLTMGLSFGPWKDQPIGDKLAHGGSCKRHKSSSHVSSLTAAAPLVFVKQCSDVFGSHVEELDLELRLGDPSKVLN
ncbi:hypothetical protein Dimus_033813 [Dionaea muscipula]